MEWEYTDSRGVVKTGTVEHVSDHGGSDVTYMMRGSDGVLDCLSGLYMKRTGAHALWNVETCTQCRAPMNPVARMLGPVCNKCCRKNHAAVNG